MVDFHKKLSEHRAARAAREGASGLPPVEPQGHSSAFAVAGGCLPPAEPLPQPKMESYDAYLAAWKAKHGVTDQEAAGPELRMLAQDAKDTSKDYCLGCGEQFRVCDMTLITRSIDPYVQYDDERPREDDYIAKKHRVRMCKPCYKRDYESFDEPGEDNVRDEQRAGTEK